MTVVYIGAEAYVDAINRQKSAPLVIATEKGKIAAGRADFMIRSDKNETKAMLNAGKLNKYSYRLDKMQTLISPGDF